MNAYNLLVNIYFDLSDLYCLGMATGLSQSLDLSIQRHKDYIPLISTADRIDLVLSCLLVTVDRCKDDIGSKINDTSSVTGWSAIVYGFNWYFPVFVSCWLQDKINWHAHEPKGMLFGPALELSRSPRPRVFHINTLLARPVGPSFSNIFSWLRYHHSHHHRQQSRWSLLRPWFQSPQEPTSLSWTKEILCQSL